MQYKVIHISINLLINFIKFFGICDSMSGTYLSEKLLPYVLADFCKCFHLDD